MGKEFQRIVGVEFYMKYFLHLVCGLTTLLMTTRSFARNNAFPADVDAALVSPEKVVIYSLEPGGQTHWYQASFHHSKILGKATLTATQSAVAIGAFRNAVSSWKDVGMYPACFDPRQALRITKNGHKYDLLICYECSGLEVFRDGESIPSTSLGVSGTPEALNNLLTQEHIPLSKSVH